MLERTRRVMHASDYSDDQWERLWFTLEERNWRSLALVATQDGDHALDTAHAICHAATVFQDASVVVIDATAAGPGDVATIRSTIGDCLWGGQRVLVALGNPLVRSSSIPLSRFTDSAILCVALNRADLMDARRIVRCIGASRVIGSIALDP